MGTRQTEAFREEAKKGGLIFYQQEEALAAGERACHFFDSSEGSFFVPHNRKKILALIALAKRYGQGEDEALLNQRIRRTKLKDAEKPEKVWQPRNHYSKIETVPPSFTSLKQWLKEQGMLQKRRS